MWLLLPMLLATVSAPAQITLTWSAAGIDWIAPSAGGSMDQFFHPDPAAGGSEVEVAITGTTSFYSTSYPNDLTSPTTGGISPAKQALQLQMNWSADTQTITVTIKFSTTDYAAGVDSVSFQLFDIDQSGSSPSANYTDQVTAIKGRYGTGAYVGPTTVTVGTKVTKSGSGTGITLTGNALNTDTTSGGNATIDFGSSAVTEVTFTYGNDAAQTQANPATQVIGLYNITYRPRPVPEVSPGLAAIAVCGLTVGFRSIRSLRDLRKFSPGSLAAKYQRLA